jgi:hypothetical protein
MRNIRGNGGNGGNKDYHGKQGLLWKTRVIAENKVYYGKGGYHGKQSL